MALAGPVLFPLYSVRQVHRCARPLRLDPPPLRLTEQVLGASGSLASSRRELLHQEKVLVRAALACVESRGPCWAGLRGAGRAGPRGLECEGRELGYRGLL